MTDLDKLLAAAIAKVHAMTPEELKAMLDEQGRSWVKGEIAMNESASLSPNPRNTPKVGGREYFIAFDTKEAPGLIKATKVTIDSVFIRDMDKQMAVNLIEDPLYPQLMAYMEANK